jgi:REP-associated tyrosine transposase
MARAVAVAFPHHVTQRGNHRQQVFENDDDYTMYLDWLKTYSRRHSLKIWAYCLMNNHVHFISVPMEADSLAKVFDTLHMRSSQHINRKTRATGHLWQGRFFSCILDERHLYACIRYVENNPVRVGLVKRAEEYRWSSAVSHVLRKDDPILSDDCPVKDGVKYWIAYLEDRDDSAVDLVPHCSKTGRPCGDESFVARMETVLGRKLVPRDRGRPKRRG